MCTRFPLADDRFRAGLFLREEAGGASTQSAAEAKGDTTGNKSEPVSGEYFVNEVFAELLVPLLSGMLGAEELELNASARISNYSNFGTEFTWKAGARWQIIQDLAVRGTYSTAFRAPPIPDLFSGSSDSFPLTPDPCSNAIGVAADKLPGRWNSGRIPRYARSTSFPSWRKY